MGRGSLGAVTPWREARNALPRPPPVPPLHLRLCRGRPCARRALVKRPTEVERLLRLSWRLNDKADVRSCAQLSTRPNRWPSCPTSPGVKLLARSDRARGAASPTSSAALARLVRSSTRQPRRVLPAHAPHAAVSSSELVHSVAPRAKELAGMTVDSAGCMRMLMLAAKPIAVQL